MDNERYLQVFERFLSNTQKLFNSVSPEAGECLEEICAFLRIACIKADFYDINFEGTIEPNSTIFLYMKGDYDPLDKKTFRFDTPNPNGGTAIYTINPIRNDVPWSDEEKEKIKNLIDMLYIFNSRSKIMDAMYRLTFFDREVTAYNLIYYNNFTKALIRENILGSYSALYFNIKQLNFINQKIGRRNGTLLMSKFVKMLEGLLSYDETVCRVGGDNFIAVVKKESVDAVIDMLMGAEVPVDDNIKKIRISASVGLYDIPDDDSVKIPSELLDKSFLAMHIAKKKVKPTVVRFDNELMKIKEKQSAVSDAFDDALKNKEFKVYYQPKISVRDYRLSGAEALCRWYNKGEIVSPANFIPILEQSSDICILDFYMLEGVCSDIRGWIDEGTDPVCISINLSRRHLADLELIEKINTIVDKYNVPHELIEFELTETTTDIEKNELRNAMLKLQECGFTASVDDFGIGYSSLNLIKELPWNVLKLDKSLLPVDGADNIQLDKIMYKYIVAMAKEMGLKCVAEGVETLDQLQLISESDCEFVQGFLFDKPLDKASFDLKLKNRQYAL